MSAEAIYRISTTLRDRLEQGINAGLLPDARHKVQLSRPTVEGGGTSGNYLSWWLYQVTEDEFARNQPPTQVRADAERAAPLRLNLHYLLTPTFETAEQDMQILGLAMRWLHANAVLNIRNPTDGFADVIRLSIGVSDLEGLSRIWDALNQSYRLSVGYLVRTARIDPVDTTPVTRVVDTAAGWTATASEEEGP